MHGHPSCLHLSGDNAPAPLPRPAAPRTRTQKASQIHSYVQTTSVQSRHIYRNQPKQHTFYNWPRIRAHGALSNLWRLCFMLESVRIMQRRDIMPPFSLIASVLFPCMFYGDYPTHFILFFLSFLILYLILFSLSL